MSLAKFLNKPEYIYRPSSVLRKLFKPSSTGQLFTTPWKTKIIADWTDAIGGSIGLFGIYDLATTELLWRLIQPGNFVLDIGANIGYMTGLCSNRVGKTGIVWAFEPNPLLLDRLKKNIAQMPFANTRLFESGLSDKAGPARLIIPGKYAENAGIAYVAASNQPGPDKAVGIQLITLDSVIPVNTNIDVLKIDVEGHELSVFKGSQKLLRQKRIKHIVFEDLQEYPSAVSGLLLEYGYTIYRIEKKLRNISLEHPQTPPSYKSKTTNYIATLDNDVIQKAVKESGYKCLFPGRSKRKPVENFG